MKQLAYIQQGQSEYEPRLRELLDGTGIDPHEFLGLDYFSLTPFFVLAGATVGADAHTHGTDLHVVGLRVSIDEELEEAFYATLPMILADAYVDQADTDPNGGNA
jgi:hypothetical protein